ncbi:hypothetical protein AB0D10_31950 [Kitasatospora sp. NPDC048545]|uniref:hypothetical protein n=1 Tax=Kitasatospora sp. NPDC048545 TaxID=3157208 RepID=UPI0033DA9491
MIRETLLTGLLALGVGAGPACLALGVSVADPDDARKWVWSFVALAVAMIGTVYGPEWVEGRRRRRRAQARVRARLDRSEAEQRARL